MLAEPPMSLTQAPADDAEDLKLPEQLAKLCTCIDETPEGLATGNKDLQVAALQAAKYVFDLALQSESKSRAVIAELLSSLSPSMAPQTRSQSASHKSKAGQLAEVQAPVLVETPLPELCVDDMDKEQIWAQLELRNQNVASILEYALESTGELPESEDGQSDSLMMKQRNAMLGVDEDEEMDFDDEDGDEDEETDSEEDSDDDDEEEEEEGESEEEEDGIDLGENITKLRDVEDEEGDEVEEAEDAMDLDASGSKRPPRRKGKGKGHPVLDDGFFNLAAFNAETEATEARKVSRGRLNDEDDEDDEEDGEAEVNLFTSIDGMDGADEPAEMFYKDFFAPPSRKALQSMPTPPQAGPSSGPKKSGVRFHDEVRVKNIKAKGKNLPVSMILNATDDDDDEEFGEKMLDSEDEDLEEEDLSDEAGSGDEEMASSEDDGSEESGSEDGGDTRETIERFKDDLFADDEDTQDTGLTTHEKRIAALQAEIAALESENVGDKHWTLMGEATSRSRPQNALLEEDLEFDRVMKSVPVITEDIVHSLEERIKARIIEDRFDDVVRRRPMDDKPFLPSRFFELQDTKSKQSLAEIYEDEYVATKTGGVAGEDRDGKLKKEHDEIEKMWEAICMKMDALSNAHFTPKAPKASITTISNIASATMESALPTTKATSTMLAPEEIFAPSAADLRAKSELTPAEKRALHNKTKKVKRKARDQLEKSVDQFAKMKGGRGSVNKQKEAALKSVVKNGKGVTVIGKKNKDVLKDASKKKART